MSSVLLTAEDARPGGAQPAGEGRSLLTRRRRWVLGLFGAWLLTGVFLVAPDQQAVVTTWGRVTSPRVLPGLHYALPWPIQQVYKLKVHQLRRTVIGGDVADIPLGRLQPAASEFLSGDQNLLNVRIVAQYSVSEPRDYLFRAADVDQVVGAAVESELARRLAHTAVDSIMTTDKVAIQNDVLLAAQRCLEEYHVGVALSSVNLENVAPPPDAADAFRDVAGARADAIRFVNEAQGYANDLLPRAHGEAEQMEQAAQAYKGGKVNRALGDAARFDAVEAEYAKAPEVTSTRVYIEAMEQILPQMRKLIVDSNGNFDLSIIGKDDSPGTVPK
jgi:modulator of FtsH protease HflK